MKLESRCWWKTNRENTATKAKRKQELDRLHTFSQSQKMRVLPVEIVGADEPWLLDCERLAGSQTQRAIETFFTSQEQAKDIYFRGYEEYFIWYEKYFIWYEKNYIDTLSIGNRKYTMNGLKKLPLIIKPLFWNSNTNDSSPQCIKYSLNGILKVWFLSSCEKKELPNSPLCLWKYWDIGGEPPPMKDQQGKYSNESRTKTGKQAWKLLYKSLTGWEGNYINISLQRAYRADTGLFDDSERDSREIQTFDNNVIVC